MVLTRPEVSSRCNASCSSCINTFPMFHSFPHCQSPTTAVFLDSLGEIMPSSWLDFTAADFGWRGMSVLDANMHH